MCMKVCICAEKYVWKGKMAGYSVDVLCAHWECTSQNILVAWIVSYPIAFDTIVCVPMHIYENVCVYESVSE